MPTAPEEWIPIGDIFRDRGECSSCYGSSGWQASAHQETCQERLLVLQLQGLLCGSHGACGWRLQVRVGGHQWIWKYV